VPSTKETLGETIGDGIEEALETNRGSGNREPVWFETKELTIAIGS
jgi:hypothetical protein